MIDPDLTFVQSCADDICSLTVLLSVAASAGDRASIIRYCSHISSIVSNALEVTVSDGVSIVIK